MMFNRSDSTQYFCAAPGFHFRLGVKARPLNFRRPVRTSRNRLETMQRYEITATTWDGRCGVGEATPMPGLSIEDGPDYLRRLAIVCSDVNRAQGLAPDILDDAPSIRFGIETALLSAQADCGALWDSPFSQGRTGLRIHHLVWLDEPEAMLLSMAEGVRRGFSCLKMKVGAHHWETELALLREARTRFPGVEIRVDANGAWAPQEAAEKLETLAAYGIEHIEQPIRPGQWEAMARLMQASPLPIVLDEELIAARTPSQRERLLDTLHPYAIVIRPSLNGGFSGAEEWAALATERCIRWWVNSALEGPHGHAALCEWAALRAPSTLHGLGTGQLYADAEPSRVQLRGCELWERR